MVQQADTATKRETAGGPQLDDNTGPRRHGGMAVRTPRLRSSRALLAGLAVAAAGVVVVRQIGRSSDARRSGDQGTFPPLDTPKPIADGIWIVDSGPLHTMGLELPVRMTVIRLAGGDLLIHSPTRFTPALADALRALGRVAHLVAPNIAHWMFVADWQRAFPDAKTWAAPELGQRAQVRQSAIRIDAELGEQAPPAWADEIAQGIVAGGGGFREVWFFHHPTRTLLLVDLIQNLAPDQLPPVSRLLMRAAAATRGTTARYLRPVIRLGGRAARDAIRSIVALEPERVIFAHGRLFTDGAAGQLRQAFAWLV